MAHRPAFALLLLAAAPALAAAPKGPPPATPIGKPVDCVHTNQIRETRVRDDSTIDFYMSGGTIYRNTLPNSCPELGFEESFSYSLSIPQLCSVDIITVLHHSGGLQRGASCGLGKFQPVTIAGKERR